jgi:transcriptional regulator with XRE-family HTH domain
MEMAVRLPKQLGTLFLKQRTRCGLSQEQVAESAGLSRSFYSDVERGKRNVSIVTLYRLAAALNTTGHELLRDLEAQVPQLDGQSGHQPVIQYLLSAGRD